MTTIDPPTSPIDTIRDWLAERAGWTLHEFEYEGTTGPVMLLCWKRGDVKLRHKEHPYPPTISGAASAMPVGWRSTVTIYIGHTNTVAAAELDGSTRRAEGPTEMEARFRLAAACIIAQESSHGS